MFGKKAKSLVDYLGSLNLYSIIFEYKSASLKLICRSYGNGLKIASIEYEVLLKFDNAEAFSNVFVAHIAAWLIENDPEREKNKNKDPEISVQKNDMHKVFIVCKVQFQEDIELIESPDGDLEFRGKKYLLSGGVSLNTADSVWVGSDSDDVSERKYHHVKK